MVATRKAGRPRQRGRASDVASIVGCDQSTVARWKTQPGFPPVADDGSFEVFAVINWWIRKQVAAEQVDLLAELSGSGEPSEGLERYRLARAQQEEIKLAQQRGQVILLNDFEEVCQAILSPYRRLAEHVKHRSDSELWSLVEECNELVLAGLERLYSPKS